MRLSKRLDCFVVLLRRTPRNDPSVGGHGVADDGDVIQPEDDLIAIGSGGPFAQSAARALLNNTDMNARDIVEQGLKIDDDIVAGVAQLPPKRAYFR